MKLMYHVIINRYHHLIILLYINISIYMLELQLLGVIELFSYISL